MSLRILHLSKFLPGYAGGLEAVVAMQASAALRLGHEVAIAGVAPPRSRALASAQTGVRELPMASRGELGPVSLSLDYFRLGAELARADIVHVHMPNPLAELALLLHRGPRGRVVPVVHAGILRFPPLNKLWEALIQRQVLAGADTVVACAAEMFTAWEFLAPFEDKAFVMPFAVPEPPRVTPRRSGRARHELLAIGRLVPYKGYDVLLRAVLQLEDDVHLTIVGDGPERARLQGLASERVSLRADVSDLEKHQLLAGCDLFVQPAVTRAECFGIAVVEAFAHGKAAVVSAIPTGLSYLARGGACGAVVAPGDVTGLAAALREALRNEPRRLAAGAANYLFWQDRLSVSAFDRRYAELLARAGEPAVGAATSTTAA